VIQSYLQWVGTSHYATIASYLAEVRVWGVVRRLPNLGMARQLAHQHPVVFLVHDRGSVRACPACAREVLCDECRGASEVTVGGVNQRCPSCKGLGTVEQGTGGYAEVDGERWDYSRWLRLRKLPRHQFWSEGHQVGVVKPCQACGGRGRIPIGQVFGVYAPGRVVLVGKGKQQQAQIEGFDHLHEFLPHPTNGTGRKLQPGLYALARYDGEPSAELVDALLELTGSEAEVHGEFAILREPIPYVAKQFRGLKRWAPPVVDGLDGEA
jgi:hypothetical protein